MRIFTLIIMSVVLISAQALAEKTSGDNVIFFLHNAWFEKNTAGEPHQKFGSYDFDGIKDALAAGGRVNAPQRGPDADPRAAADQLVRDIRKLLATGRSPTTIKVIGTSKGGHIAQLASEALNQADIRWVLVGGCHNERMAKGDFPKMTGKVLSVYDTSDEIAGPCQPYEALYKGASSFSEVALATGRDHGFLFTAEKAWIQPALSW